MVIEEYIQIFVNACTIDHYYSRKLEMNGHNYSCEQKEWIEISKHDNSMWRWDYSRWIM